MNNNNIKKYTQQINNLHHEIGKHVYQMKSTNAVDVCKLIGAINRLQDLKNELEKQYCQVMNIH